MNNFRRYRNSNNGVMRFRNANYRNNNRRNNNYNRFGINNNRNTRINNFNKKRRNPRIRNNNNIQNRSNFSSGAIISLKNELNKLKQTIKTTSLGSTAIKNVNNGNKSTANNPSTNKREIRYDRLYDAFTLYKMGKYYSFYRSPNLIVRIPIYNTWTFTLTVNYEAQILWFPYAYPYLSPDYRVGDQDDRIPDTYSYLFVRNIPSAGSDYIKCSLSDINGTYRLLSASMRITNITTNTNKGGSYTIYRLTNNEGQPCVFNFTDGHGALNYPATINAEVCKGDYNQELIKFVYNGNQVGQIDEYNVYQGNTIFQSATEYMGSKTPNSYSNRSLPVGGNALTYNPQGLNIKYLIKIDPMSTIQVYKIQSVSIFEVCPSQSTTTASLAYKVDKIASSEVLKKAKDSFPLKIINS